MQRAARLEQIIIKELELKLGSSSSPDAPEISVTAQSGTRALTRTGVVKPMSDHEITVSANYAVTVDGKVVIEGTRRASAHYRTSGQVLADEAAAEDASERAEREVAETIRLSILGALAVPVREAALAGVERVSRECRSPPPPFLRT